MKDTMKRLLQIFLRPIATIVILAFTSACAGPNGGLDLGTSVFGNLSPNGVVDEGDALDLSGDTYSDIPENSDAEEIDDANLDLSGAVSDANNAVQDATNDLEEETNYDDFTGPVAIPVNPPKEGEDCLASEEDSYQIVMLLRTTSDANSTTTQRRKSDLSRSVFITTSSLTMSGNLSNIKIENDIKINEAGDFDNYGEILVCQYDEDSHEYHWAVADSDDFNATHTLVLGAVKSDTNEENTVRIYVEDWNGASFSVPDKWISPRSREVIYLTVYNDETDVLQESGAIVIKKNGNSRVLNYTNRLTNSVLDN